MKIALIATHHVDYTASLAVALADRGHEVMLLVSRRCAERQLREESRAVLADRLALFGIVPHHYAPVQPWIAWRCLQHIRNFAPNVVHVQDHPTRSMGLLARWLNGTVPLVTTVHDPRAHEGKDAHAAQRLDRYIAELRRRSDGLIVHGPSLIDDLAGLGIERGRIAAIPHGVLYFGRHGEVAALEVQPDPRRLIFFGRMQAYKGLDTLLSAHSIWREWGTDIRLTIAGAGPELSRCREALSAPGIELHPERIDQAELEVMVRGCAAAVLPYHGATQSGVVASTFGAERPVIVTDVGELAAATGAGGLVVPPRDPLALAEAGRRIIEEAGLLARLEAGVRERIEGELSWVDIAGRTEEFYRATIAGHRARRPSER